MIELPRHKCSLTITHNDHKDYHRTLAQEIELYGDDNNWPSDEAKQRAIDTDEIWVIHWYPDTPIGSYRVAAPTLEEALAFANSVNSNSR
jgi:hypothetical protein|uniref:Uncharacterized protein n=1 Tax=Myoviridae sp. ctshb19 TaxID=2825194 RepID=A0A8S5UGC9_9CAUD|nr:MAG TPA: hypothetical protein [Myoviridae sp. ctshb19]